MKTISKYLLLTVLLIGCLACSDKKKIQLTNLRDAIEHLESVHPEMRGCFDTLKTPNLFIDSKNKQIIFLNQTQQSFKFKTRAPKDYDVIEIDNKDIKSFIAFLEAEFGLTDSNSKNAAVEELAEKIGACNDYVNKINTTQWYDKVLSLLYNTCIGDNQKHIGIRIANKKLEIIRDEDDLFCRLDTNKFINIIENLDEISSPAVLKNRIIKDSAIIKEKFAYLNIRKDELVLGDEISEALNSDKRVMKIKENPLDIFIADGDGIKSLKMISPNIYRLNEEIFSQQRWVPETNRMEVQASGSASKLDILFLVLLLISLIANMFLILGKNKFNKENFKHESSIESTNEQHSENNSNVNSQSFNIDKNDSIDVALTKMDKTFGSSYYKQYIALNDKVFDTVCAKCLNNSENNDDSVKHLLKQVDSGFHTDLYNYYINLERTIKTLEEQLKATNSELYKLNETKNSEIQNFEKAFKFFKCSNKDLYTYLKNAIEAFENSEHNISDAAKLIEIFKTTSGQSLNTAKLSEVERMVKNTLTMLDCHDQPIDAYLQNAIQNYENSRHNISDAAKLIEIFKTTSGESLNTSKIVQTAAIIDDAISKMESVAQKEGEPDYWDKYAIILMSISYYTIPMLKTYFKGEQLSISADKMLHSIKNDMISTYIARLFLRELSKKDIDKDAFINNANKKIYDVISKFNSTYNSPITQISIGTGNNQVNVSEKTAVYASALENVRNYEKTLKFVDRMWNYFVKDFVLNPNTSDKGKLLGQIFNIAYHTADYIDCVKNSRSVKYCYNLNYLLNDFDESKTECLEFVSHHCEKSSVYSDFIYELTQELGAKDLKILVDKYKI